MMLEGGGRDGAGNPLLPIYSLSNFHCGQSPPSFGSHPNRKIDLLLCCQHDERTHAERNDNNFGYSSASGNTLVFIQYDGFAFHSLNEQTRLHGRFDKSGAPVDNHAVGCRLKDQQQQQPAQPTFRKRAYVAAFRDDEHELRLEYGRALSSISPKLRIEYKVTNSCQYYHKNPLPCPSTFCGPPQNLISYRNLRSLMRNRFPDRSVGVQHEYGSGPKTINIKQLTDRVRENVLPVSGFVTLSGGSEREWSKILRGQVGFLLQRGVVESSPDRPVPGNWTRWQDTVQSTGLADKFDPETPLTVDLSNRLKKEQTFSADRFHHDSDPSRVETIAIEYWRFLLNRRSFDGFTVRHFIAYEERQWLTPFVVSMLNERHALQNTPGSDVTYSLVLKLVLNR